MKKIVRFLDKLEDRVRGKLSRFPIFYAFVGGVGIVIFWRGIWHSADFLMEMLVKNSTVQDATIDLGRLPWWDGPLSAILGAILLLISGLFVSDFIGSEIIISGIRGEKKLAEKTEAELAGELAAADQIKRELKNISARLENLEKKL